MCNCGQCSSEDPEAFDVTREYKTVRCYGCVGDEYMFRNPEEVNDVN